MKTTAERQKEFRERQKEKGLKKREIYATDKNYRLIKKFIKELKK